MKRTGHTVPKHEQDAPRVWVTFVGPLVLYTLYFSVVYLMGEAGCKVEALRFPLFGVPFVTVFAVALGVVALLTLLPLARSARGYADIHEEARQFIGRAGVIMCGLVSIFIVATIVMALAVRPC